ncbi:MAG: HNH endonuclease [Actinomycetota bacterium]|nr:HNH endonuclease [Actinomycetota bacterium]
MSNDQLAEQITTWAGRIAAGEAQLVRLIGEFDRREAWGGPGLLSCGHWLSWRLGMGLKAAHERVRVARALPLLPVTAAAFAAGRLSWTQVRAITRVATPADEDTYVELARHATGAQLERLVRGVRRAQRIAEDEADPEAAAYRMRTRVTYDTDGTLILSVRLPAEHGAVLVAALEQARDEVDRAAQADRPAAADPAATCGKPSSAEDTDTTLATRPVPASLADGLLHLARSHLQTAAADRPHATRRHRARLIAHVDPLSGWARLHDGELLPPGTAPPLPQPLRLRPVTAADHTVHDLHRTARHPGQALRDLLGTLDGNRCRYPGCTRRRHLHAHHVIPWAEGGPTDLANLILVCPRHHTLIHDQHHDLTLHPDRHLTITTANGTSVPHRPPPPWQPAGHLDPGSQITPDTLPPNACDRLHLHYAVAVLMQQAA